MHLTMACLPTEVTTWYPVYLFSSLIPCPAPCRSLGLLNSRVFTAAAGAGVQNPRAVAQGCDFMPYILQGRLPACRCLDCCTWASVACQRVS